MADHSRRLPCSQHRWLPGKGVGWWPAHPALQYCCAEQIVGQLHRPQCCAAATCPTQSPQSQWTQVRGLAPQAYSRAGAGPQGSCCLPESKLCVEETSHVQACPATLTPTCWSRAAGTSLIQEPPAWANPHLLEQGLRAHTVLQGLAAGHAPAHHLKLQPEKGALAQDAAAVLQQGADLRGVAAALALQLAAPALQGMERLLALGTQPGSSLAVALTPAGPQRGGAGSVLSQVAAGVGCRQC